MKGLILSIMLMFSGFAIYGNLILLDENPLKISVHHKLRVGSVETDDIYRLMGITTDELGNVYITDALDFSIKKFDKNGEFIKKTGRRGSGPGEMISPGHILYNKGLLYITQQMHPGILIFDKDLNFKNQLPSQIPILDIKLKNDTIFVTSSIFKNLSKIGIINRNGEYTVKSIDQKKSQNELTKIFLYNVKNFCIDNNLNFYTCNLFLNKIEKFNSKYELKYSLTFRSFEDFEPKENEFKLPKKTFFKDLDIDKKGFIYCLGGSYSKNPSRDVYILSNKLERISEITLKDPSHFIHIGSNNLLYSRAEAGTAFDVYQIKYGERK